MSLPAYTEKDAETFVFSLFGVKCGSSGPETYFEKNTHFATGFSELVALAMVEKPGQADAAAFRKSHACHVHEVYLWRRVIMSVVDKRPFFTRGRG